MKCTRVFSHWSALWAGLLFFIVFTNAQDASESGDSAYDESILIDPSPMTDYLTSSDYLTDKTITFKVKATTSIPKTSKPPDIVPTILPTPKMTTLYIEISLKISLEEYLKRWSALNNKVLIVLQKFLPTDFTTMKRAADEIYKINVTLDEQKSSDHTSFLQVYIINSETRQEDSEATEQFFYLLASKSANFTAQLEAAIGIVS